MPKCRVEADKIRVLSRKQDCRSVTSPKILGQAMIAMRLSHSLTATQIAQKIKVNTSTISRYENGHFTIEQADTGILERYALACGEDRHSLFNDYLLFRKYHKQILQAYIKKRGITKSELGKFLGVSKTLVLTWFNKENRCPSAEVWEKGLREFTTDWFKNNSKTLQKGRNQEKSVL